MKVLSWLLTVILMALALSFALNNRETATINLWPFGFEVAAPLYLMTLGTLFFGLLMGAFIAWLGMLPHRFEVRRLRKDIEGLHVKMDEIQQKSQRPEADNGYLPAPKPRWRLWKGAP